MKNLLLPHRWPKPHWLALLAGGMTMLSFAPFRIFPLAIIGIALLETTLEGVSPRQAAQRAGLFGLALFGSGIYWIFICLRNHSEMSSLLSLVITVGFICLLAAFPALTGWLLNRYFPRGHTLRELMAFPALWVLTEWLRSLLFTGFPWLTLGYSQMHSPLRGYAPLMGVSGVSLAVLLSSGCLLKVLRDYQQKNYRGVWAALMGFFLLWALGTTLNRITWTKPEGAPITVSMVQGNIPVQRKWSEEMLQPTLDRYRELSGPHWGASDIVIWPESAIPDYLANQEPFVNELDALAKKHHSTFITGIPIQMEDKDRYYNAVIALGNGKGYYLKHRLVPFGEYIPLGKVFPNIMNFLHIPLTGFTPSYLPSPPLEAGALKILTVICYESIFPEQVRFRDGSINLLLTVSNDGWFGHSTAQAQHLEMAAMRALETGRPMLFASNDGPTAIINAHGDVLAIAPPHVAWVLSDRVQPTQGKTPWLFGGMDPVLLLSVFLLFQAWRQKRRLDRV